MKYHCGCPVRDSISRNLGKGKPRIARIAKIEASKCRLCTVTELANKLTRINGTLYTAEERSAYIERHVPMG